MQGTRYVTLGLVLLGAAAGSAQAATVTVVHGIPGFRADVYVNGKKTLQGFEAGTMTDPIRLPAGRYRLDVREAGAPASARPELTGRARLGRDTNASIVGHLDARGRPRRSIFVNDVSRPAAGRTRLTVRHTADAPPVDIIVNGRPLISGLVPPREGGRELPAGTHTVAVAVAGTNNRIWGPARLSLKAGSTNVVYAIGSQEDGTLDQLVQRFDPRSFRPGSVPAGSSGLAADDREGRSSALLLGFAGLAAVGAAASVLVLARAPARRRR
jgi:hypothetical protein